MRRLDLIRHAEAEMPLLGQSDFQRRLTGKGLEDAHALGRSIFDDAQQPQLIVSSTARRAITTALSVSDELGLNPRNIAKEDRIYEAPLANLIQVIEQFPDKCEQIAMVGHNPGLSMLVDWLTDEQRSMPPCCQVQITLPLDSWQALSQGVGSVALWRVGNDSR